MTVFELFSKHVWSDVKQNISVLYLDYDEYLLEILEKSFLKIKEMNGIKSDFVVYMDYEESYYPLSVYGIKSDSENKYVLSYRSWEEWLGMSINESSLKNFGESWMLAGIMIEMTEMGYTASAVLENSRKLMEELDRRSKQIDVWIEEGTIEQHTYTFEQVMERIRQKKT